MARNPAIGVTGGQRPGIGLPADLGGSLRLLDDDQLDRLAMAVAEETRRREHGDRGEAAMPERNAERPGSAKPSRTRPATDGGAAAVTPGQERLILAAFRAGVKPAAIAREFRVARSTVMQVVDAARRDHA